MLVLPCRVHAYHIRPVESCRSKNTVQLPLGNRLYKIKYCTHIVIQSLFSCTVLPQKKDKYSISDDLCLHFCIYPSSMLADYVAIEKYLHSRVACRQRGRGCRRGGGVAPPAGGRGCTPGSRGTRRGRGSVSLPTETLFVVSTHDQACGSEFIFCGSGSSIVKNYLMKS